MNIQPWLSVLIPTYNGADYLPFALNSIVAQNASEVENIVVDDGSTDATLSVLDSFRDKLPIKILQRERQGNWAANTNYALSHARGEYVCFLHQDDLWFDDRLKIIRKLIFQFPEVVLFLHPSYYLDVAGKNLGLWQCPLPSCPKTICSDLMIEKLLIQNFISIPAPVFRRDVAEKVGGLDETSWYTADWDFWLKVAHWGDTVYYPKPLTGFRIHPFSQTVIRSSSLQDFRHQLENVAGRHLETWRVSQSRKKSTAKIAYFSIRVNTGLAGSLHGNHKFLFSLIGSFLLLGPAGWLRYLRDSRIWERVSARLKARIGMPTMKNGSNV